MELYEDAMPWILYRYNRPDWLAMIIGGRVYCKCIICGIEESINIPIWDVWFPPKRGKHPRREEFCKKHEHPDKNKNRILWNKPLGNI